MSLELLVAVGLLGGAGAVARFVLDDAVSSRLNGDFPSGTLAVNLSGSLLLGVLAGAGLDREADQLLAVGLLGSYTTFSTWMLESHRLGEDGRLLLAAANLAGSLVLGVLAVWAGRAL